MTTPTLRTARLVLREFVLADVPAMFPSFVDAEAMRWWSRGPVASEEELASWLFPKEEWREGRQWAIAESDAGPAIQLRGVYA